MTISATTPVGAIAAQVPSSVRVFQRHGLDFCCGGKKPLAAACEELGLSTAAIAHEIEQSTRAPSDLRDWPSAPLRDLTAHIVASYHEPLREELPRLEALAGKVATVHRARAAERLDELQATLGELAADLLEHMQKEERVVFPAITRLEDGGTSGLPLGQPVRVLELEHDRAGELLSALRRVTGDFVPPDWACATVRALYEGLAELETEMQVHVHLENNVLFPRALALAGASSDRRLPSIAEHAANATD